MLSFMTYAESDDMQYFNYDMCFSHLILLIAI